MLMTKPAPKRSLLPGSRHHLLNSGKQPVREAGRALLRRVIAEYPDSLDMRTAWEQLGDSLACEGRLTEAESALRETLRLCANSPLGDSGTTGVTELRMAELILLGGDSTRLDEAADLLRTVEPKVQGQAFLRNVVFRFLLASARVAYLQGDPAAARLARDALDVAAEKTPSLPRHPDVGRPTASASEIAELTRISMH